MFVAVLFEQLYCTSSVGNCNTVGLKKCVKLHCMHRRAVSGTNRVSWPLLPSPSSPPPRLNLLSASDQRMHHGVVHMQLLCQNASVLICAPCSCQQWNKAERCPVLIEQRVTVHTLGFVVFAAKPIAHLWKANLPCVSYLHTHHQYCDFMMT